MAGHVQLDPEREVADLHLDGGCPLCAGPLEVRTTPGTTYAYCRSCVWLSKPRLAVGQNGLAVMHRAAAA